MCIYSKDLTGNITDALLGLCELTAMMCWQTVLRNRGQHPPPSAYYPANKRPKVKHTLTDANIILTESVFCKWYIC